MEKEEIIKKWLEGSLSDDEKKSFEKTKEYKELNRLNNAILSFKAPVFPVEEELNRFSHIEPKEKIIALDWIKPLLRIAAVLLLVSSFGYWVYNTNFNSKIGETIAYGKTELYLPDSSFVALNKHSNLVYFTEKWSETREVKLTGEAFFKVAHGSKFDVITNAGVITVLGTAFNVKNREGYFEVICYKGLVEVVSHKITIQLSANHSVRFINNEMHQEVVLNKNAPDWLNEESSFKSVPFYLVLEEFERQYNVTIIAKELDLSQSFTGGFDYKDINVALKSITTPGNYSYQINKDTIILFAKNE